MPRRSFHALAQELLDAGVAPRFAERVRRELDDHYRDLVSEALANERSIAAAELEARRRLGCDAMIAQEFMSRPELMSWVYRSRWFVRCLRGACRVYLILRGLLRLVVAYQAAFARFAAAGLAAALLVSVLLLGLGHMIGGTPPAAVRAYGGVQSVAVVDASRAPDRVESRSVVADAADEPRPRRPMPSPGFAAPEVVLPELPAAELPVQASVAVELEMPPAMPRMTPVDADLLPIFRAPAQFPEFAAARGIEGYVLIEYTVTRTGSVSDIVVVESSSELFERPALEAVEKFRYRPRIVDGMAVPVRGVRTRMRFVLEA